MKGKKTKQFLLAFLLFLPFFFGNAGKDDLKDVTKPYTGIYECKIFRLGVENKRDTFETLTVELKDDGSLILFCKTARGKQTEKTARYRVDREKETITVTGELFGKKAEREFSYKDGEITVIFNIADKTAYLLFSR